MRPLNPSWKAWQTAQDTWRVTQTGGTFAVLTTVLSADVFEQERIYELRQLIHAGQYRVPAECVASSLMPQMLG